MPYCRECINELLQFYKEKYSSERIAVKILCHILDAPYDDAIYENVINNNTQFLIGVYLRQMNNGQNLNKTFANSIFDGVLAKTENELREEREIKWSRNDSQNKRYVISTYGYDPFDNNTITDEDRRILYNSLAGYCDDPSVSIDNHKLQSVVQLVLMQLQCRKIDDIINTELLNKVPEDKKIKGLASTKKSLLDGIAGIVKDNNIASNYNASSKQGADTASQKMKDIEKDGFNTIKVNLFDILTAEAMKQTMDLSNQSILEQIQLDSNEYTGMLKDQYQLIQDYNNKNIQLEEENRLLKIKLQDLENRKRRQ